ncbi:MAG: formylglycine-generating enzyme family protein [Saprospiraceae bacterium]|nr:formylglycine-generating enzyme family protein [Saprospiraceae bacterium]
MAFIQGGQFMMGQTDGEFDESPVHKVWLSDFYLAKYEVTVKEYRAYCAATNSTMPQQPEWGFQEDHPIINISWNDAQEYIKWLNKISGAAYRLPTEAEFEYVIKSGKQNSVYPWGSGLPVNENIADESRRDIPGRREIWNGYNDGFPYTSPVGSYSPNSFGVYDINGNAWEWVQDWYGKYTSEDKSNPAGPKEGKFKVGRGASFNADPWHSRSASRAFVEPEFKGPGFRLAKSIEAK